MNALQYVTHNNADDIQTGGTSLQGEIEARYEELCALFGQPHDADQYKSDAGWEVRFGDGTVATIYNWKNGPAYCGDDGTPVEQITEWHVGGSGKRSLELVQSIVDLHREMAAESKTKSDPVSQAVNKHKEILLSIEAKHGERYARAVHFAYLMQRQVEVFSIVLNGAQSGAPCPESVADKLGTVFVELASRLAAQYMDDTEASEDPQQTREILEWAGRLINADNDSAESIMRWARKQAS